MAGEGLDGKSGRGAVRQRQARGGKIDIDLDARIFQQPLRRGVAHGDGQKAVLQRMALEDVRDLGAEDGANAVVKQCPGSMFARGAAAEVASGHQDLAAGRLGTIQYEGGVGSAVGEIAPVGEQLPAEAILGGRRQETRRNDLVGVDGGGGDNHGLRMHPLQLVHYKSSLGSAILPSTAVAAAVMGLTSKVRAPTPWRPSKFRLLVLTEYCPAPTVSPFIPKHIEHPDSRQSAPAS